MNCRQKVYSRAPADCLLLGKRNSEQEFRIATTFGQQERLSKKTEQVIIERVFFASFLKDEDKIGWGTVILAQKVHL